ncbi:hypothetical protein [Legionella sp. W05-934-2]|jgi:hypothetical protein|uniref:RipA family octameric membrane protein n=1 Tax=Legionella sp. W05-934-2 TaxID=1198649 RepID=UPI0034620668
MSLFNLFGLRVSQQIINPEELAVHLNRIKKKSPEEMTDDEKAQVLNIYTAIYPSLHEIPAQRQASHNIFFTIYTFIFSAFGYAIFSNHQEWIQLSLHSKIILLVFVDFFFLCLTYIWNRMLRAYVNFNYMLIMVTQNLEQYLPVHPLSNLFLISEQLNIPTNLAEEMAVMPKLLAILSVVASVIVIFI